MDKIKLVQMIGAEVCEGCGPDADCGENPAECFRIENAVALLDAYLAEQNKGVSSGRGADSGGL